MPESYDLKRQTPTFFKQCIDLNATDQSGGTAFHIVCKKGHMKIVELMLQKSTEFNINLNAEDNFNQTPFHLACKNNHIEVSVMTVLEFHGEAGEM